ncbi:cation-transporting P-type ATPase [bacterium]|nr:cation-transporting P-type ATPase [bacterium]NCQ55610.1 cation-transporting P-type ATPase [Candidatus Parcubacteria bacterium]NCS67435.1 cation-transporting P-type ATPase [Candidatus Peregrinibacteria bacterium]NCS96161.1 cation-transporting P-type ATPase [bacterium]
MPHKGLTQAQAQENLAKFGPNVLTAKASNPWYKILFSQFTDLLVIILLVAAILSFFLAHDPTEGFVILGIVILNALIGFVQEFRTEKTLEALKKMVHPEIRVWRDGEEKLLETKDLVPGDIVILGEGDKVPADGVVLETHSLKIEESALTGESLPIEKRLEDEVFMGTSIAKGSGVFEVTLTGMNTKFGEIARLTTETEKMKSPLQIELNRLGVFVTKVTGVLCVILFGIGLWRDYGVVESILFSVSVAIAAVPEGLPTTITIALALGATVLARKKAIVKKLSSVETLGAVTTICSDKTGTLTKNQMTVRELYLPDRSVHHVSGVGYDPQSGSVNYVGGQSKHKENEALLNLMLEACYVCNEASLVHKDHRYTILGDPTEGALLTLYAKAKKLKDLDKVEVNEIFPFDSDRKMMSVITADKSKLLVKGSPDQLLDKCTHWSDGNATHELTDEKRAQIQNHYQRMAENALRVLACAEKALNDKKLPTNETEAESGLVFLGLVGMIDPPRAEVREAVHNCRSAGIRVIVITGDYGVTAEAIARELGIVRGHEVQVLTGDEVIQISDVKLSKMLQDRSKPLIFARSLPEQKMRIVRLLQEQGEVVAMTGDGVNDAPALKKADIGVAMGITGTEVSKEAATMILTDDSFASIVTAVEEGRRIYENLKKFVWFIFSCNIAELFVIFAAIVFGLPLPLTAILILCIDLGTDILPAIALGVDEAEKGLMKKKPRDPKEKLLQWPFVRHFLLTGFMTGTVMTVGFLYTLYQYGWTFAQGLDVDPTALLQAQTVAFAMLVIVQLFNAFSARSFTRSVFTMNPFSNYMLLVAVFTSVLMVLVMIYVPFLNKALGTYPLNATDWMIVFVASLVPVAGVEGYKAIQRQKLK